MYLALEMSARVARVSVCIKNLRLYYDLSSLFLYDAQRDFFLVLLDGKLRRDHAVF